MNKSPHSLTTLQQKMMREFEERFVTYPAQLVMGQWGGSKKNETYKNSSLLINDSKPYLIITKLKKFISQAISTAYEQGRQDELTDDFIAQREAYDQGVKDGKLEINKKEVNK